MARYAVNTSAPDLTVLCIDSAEPVAGRIYHYYDKEPMLLESLFSIVELIDDLCDKIDYPQRSAKLRSFLNKNSSTNRRNRRKVEGTEKVVTKSELLNKKGGKGTFIVHVQYRQNATWQGQVTWVDQEQTQNFRSALELLKLIDSAIDSSDKKAGGKDDDE